MCMFNLILHWEIIKTLFIFFKNVSSSCYNEEEKGKCFISEKENCAKSRFLVNVAPWCTDILSTSLIYM